MSKPKPKRKKPYKWNHAALFKRKGRPFPNPQEGVDEVNEAWTETPKWQSKEKPPTVFRNPNPDELRIAKLEEEASELNRLLRIETELAAVRKRRIGELEASVEWTERELNKATRKAERLAKANQALRKNQPAPAKQLQSAPLNAAKKHVVEAGRALETARYQLGRVAQALLSTNPKR